MLILLPILATLGALAVFYVLARPRYLSDIEEINHDGALPRLSIIVPARNEAGNIPALLKSFKSEHPYIHEIIIVDDSSTDGTAELARDGGCRVVTSKTLPNDWNGKPWACQQGAEAATGEELLFLDADVRLHNGAVAKLLDLSASRRSNTAFSIYPHHRIKKPYEELSAYFNSLMVAGINAFGIKSAAGHNSALFGQALLIKKSLYKQVGGHSSVKDKVLENFYLAEELKSQDLQCSCLLGKGLVSMRMFPEGFSELWLSWKKGFVSGAAKVDSTALAFSSIWVTAGMFSLTSLALLGSVEASQDYSLFVAIAYVANVIACRWAFRIAGSFSWLTALLFPVALVFYQILFLTALIDKWRGKKAQWKGRVVG